jgi:hypothetical protein
MSDCLHCDINDLIRKYVENTDNADVSKIAAMVVESLAELILSVEPESEQAKVMADALAHFGNVFLDKGDGVEPGPHGAH